MKHGSLFSGIGGFDLASEWMGWENVFHCEINEFGREHLNYYWQNSISYEDITKTDFTIHRGDIDILTGGFPCQDASLAKSSGQEGLKGARTGLFYSMLRAIREISPKYVVAENVANIIKVNGGADFRTILSELSSMGYNAEWRVCYASEQGAPHKRARCYLVAYPNSIRIKQGETFIPYVQQKMEPFMWRTFGATIPIVRTGAWSSEPPVPVLVDGVSSKLVREEIRAMGNAIVPQVALQIFKAIEQYEKLNIMT